MWIVAALAFLLACNRNYSQCLSAYKQQELFSLPHWLACSSLRVIDELVFLRSCKEHSSCCCLPACKRHFTSRALHVCMHQGDVLIDCKAHVGAQMTFFDVLFFTSKPDMKEDIQVRLRTAYPSVPVRYVKANTFKQQTLCSYSEKPQIAWCGS